MIRIEEIIRAFEAIAPLSTQEGYDNSGLIVGRGETQVKKILLTIDTTEDVVHEAITNDCQLIIAHHPIIFRGLKKFNEQSYVERTVALAIKNDVAIVALHTNLDNSSLGVNRMIAEKIGLKKLRILLPQGEDKSIGAGMIGELEQQEKPEDFLSRVKEAFDSKVIRHTQPIHSIRSVAVCGGAGSFLLQEAKKQGADAFVSGDFKYHEFFDAESEIMILDPGHFESEQFTVQVFSRIISENFPNIALRFSEVVTNPIQYFF